MGYYTELYLNCTFKNNLPEDFERVLKYIFESRQGEVPILPDHRLFKKKKWDEIGCFGGNNYFPSSHLQFIENKNRDRKIYQLTTRFEIKDDDETIKHFLHWISPYVDPDNQNIHLGHTRNDSGDVTLIYYNDIMDISIYQPVKTS